MRQPPRPGPRTVEWTARIARSPTSGFEHRSTRSCPIVVMSSKGSMARGVYLAEADLRQSHAEQDERTARGQRPREGLGARGDGEDRGKRGLERQHERGLRRAQVLLAVELAEKRDGGGEDPGDGDREERRSLELDRTKRLQKQGG